MKVPLAFLTVCALALSSCATDTTIYRSQAPEERGERAISSNIDLVGEIELRSALLGVFFSEESFQGGGVENILFSVRSGFGLGGGTISAYDLFDATSLSVQQARKFLTAIDAYLAMDPKTLTDAQMFNFELYSGILDMTAGTERFHPFRDLTFIAICTVKKTGKSFKTVFPTTLTNLYGQVRRTYDTYTLEDKEVGKLRDAIETALKKAKPPSSQPPDDKSGT